MAESYENEELELNLEVPAKVEDKDEPLQKKKRVLTDKQKEATSANLAKGRAQRVINQKIQKEEQLKRTEDKIIKKAERIKKVIANQDKHLNKVIGLDDQEVEDEEVEPVVVHVVKKPTKKRIVYKEESDSEEEVVVRRKPQKVITEPLPPPPIVRPCRINFC